MPLTHLESQTYQLRQTDWRVGSIVYQIMVDRFAPSSNLDQKQHLYTSPRTLLDWHQLPGEDNQYLHQDNIHENEVEFWGGDFESLASRLDYLQQLGVDVVYLNPIFHAYSNHKYDTIDYFTVDPQFGSQEQLRELCEALHARGMRLILDAVFNHMGRRSPLFQSAHSQEQGPEKDYFTFNDDFPNGYLGWRNVANLPELNLDNPRVRDWIYATPESVVQHYLREVGIDGWRLDVAPDIGFNYLSELSEAAHACKPGCSVIGECWNYPEQWLTVLDGVINMHVREKLLGLLSGKMSPFALSRSFDRLLDEAGIEGLLRCHLVLDNHDIPRLATVLPEFNQRHLARTLQMTLPGCPVIYYGSELGMAGGADPANRAPMRWDLVDENNADYADINQLIKIRQENPALRFGDLRMLDSTRLFGYLRLTDKARETIIVVCNPSGHECSDFFPIRDSRLTDMAPLCCLLTGERVMVGSGMLDVTLPPHSIRVYRTEDQGQFPGYSMFKRVDR